MLEQVRRWWRRLGTPTDLGDHISVTEIGGGKLRVRVDHRVPRPYEAPARWRIRTEKAFLPRAHFPDPGPRRKIAESSEERGRVLICRDVTRHDEVVAAVSYHIDRRKVPILVTAIALRGDSPELRAESVATAWLLKQYLHALGEKIGRGRDVDFEADHGGMEAVGALLGFRRAAVPRGLRASKERYYRQSAE